MVEMAFYKFSFTWILVLLVSVCTTEPILECSSSQEQICFEKNKKCQLTIKDDGSYDFECICEYPYIQNVDICEYEPNAEQYTLKLKLSNMTQRLELRDTSGYLLAQREVQYLVQRLFPGATVSLISLTESYHSQDYTEVLTNRLRNPKTDYHATLRISAVGLSKPYLKYVWKSRALKPLKSKMFSSEAPGILIDVRKMDISPCVACSETQVCHPHSRNLCSCNETDDSCQELPTARLERGLEEWEKERFDDNLKVFRNEKSFGELWDDYQPCPAREVKRCESRDAVCVPNLASNSYKCECPFPFITSNEGLCKRAEELNVNTYLLQIPIRDDAPWSNDLENPLSLRYLKMKKNAEKFLRAVFPDASISVASFRKNEREGRADEPGVYLSFILTSDKKDYNEQTIQQQLLVYQVNSEATVPGITFSVPISNFLSSVPLVVTTTTTTTSTNTCSSSSTCTSCGSGLELSGGTCKDINECATSNPCSTQGDKGASCLNMYATYTCSCSLGYELQQGTCKKTANSVGQKIAAVARVIAQIVFQTVVFFPIIFVIIVAELARLFFNSITSLGKKRSLGGSFISSDQEKQLVDFLVKLSDGEALEKVFQRLV